MVFVSAILYFLTHHPGLTMLVLIGAGLGAGTLLAIWRRQAGWYGLVIPFFLLSPISFFTAPFLNALFLNAFGTTGKAVIVHKQETNEQFNDNYVWDYDGVLKTADGRDVAIHFRTTSATIYPIRNEILIPPANESFVAKYIPGFERNIVIMSVESNYGKRLKIEQDRAPVEKAAGQYAVSPTNHVFLKEYQAALQTFISKHRSDADPDLIQDYERELNGLSQN
jgi:hypothetical protein